MTKREKEEIYENKFFDIENAFDLVQDLYKKLNKLIDLKQNKDEIDILRKEKLDIKDFLKYIPQHLDID